MPRTDQGNLPRFKNKKDWIDWKVRPAKPEDAKVIVDLAQDVKDFILPYALSEVSVRNYIRRWVIVYNPETKEIGGAEHSISNEDLHPSDLEFLKHVCQMDHEVMVDFQKAPKKVLKAQPICPGKGTLKALTDWQKENYDEVWIWLSLKSTIRDFCLQNSIYFESPIQFLNIWKADTSEFSIGKWKKQKSVKILTGDEVKWDLQPIESTPEEAKARLVEFNQAMADKWEKGSKKYGPVFQTDPFEEAMQECLDLALYSKVIYFRIKALKERLGQ